MQFRMKSASLIVKDKEKSRAFYERILGVKTLDIEDDTYIIIEPESRFALRTEEAFKAQTGLTSSENGGAVIALLAENFDKFLKNLEENDVEYVHKVKELPTGQRVVRIYDPDKHVIEILEDYIEVMDRLLKSGISSKQIAEKLDVPQTTVEARNKKIGGK